MSPYVDISPFAVQYAKIHDLAIRAKIAGQLFDPVLPGSFLAWAKRLEIADPAELEEQVLARGQQVADWKSRFDDLKAKHDESLKNFERILSERVADNDVLIERLSDLMEMVNRAEEALRGNNLSTKEREGLLKLVIGMAVHGRWRTQTFLAGLRCDRIEAPCVFDGPINRQSSRSLPSSSTCCGVPRNAPWRTHGAASEPSSTPSQHRNATTISSTQAMPKPKTITL